MPVEWKNEQTDQFCEALLSLKTREEAYDFIEDIATVQEVKALSQRLEVARRLMAGESYPQIGQGTGASTATISRVKKVVDYGRDSLKLALQRIEGD